MNEKRTIELAVELTEKHVDLMYDQKYKDAPTCPPRPVFKASAMAEIARKISVRADKIQEDWERPR